VRRRACKTSIIIIILKKLNGNISVQLRTKTKEKLLFKEGKGVFLRFGGQSIWQLLCSEITW
jgi:hypothetical protein